MNSSPDLYACLGVARTASPEDIQLAFRQVARRFHPDTNPDPSAAEEFKLVAHAHDVLSDARQRADCDAGTAPETIIVTLATTSSCEHLRPVGEPQAVYYLVNISATAPAVFPAPPLNVCLVIDRSTSMQGPRLDQVKAAAAQLIEGLKPNDQFSVVAFSDRAEVILSAQQSRNKSAAVSRVSTIAAGGGTEILQGLTAGLQELQNSFNGRAVNQLVLLTDGRTYGDEEDCLLLATLAEGDGITISGLGIGDEWNDEFLDRLAAATGGESSYIGSPPAVKKQLADQLHRLGNTMAQHLRLQVTCDPGVELHSAFRVAPNPGPLLPGMQPLRLGNLRHRDTVSVLLEFLVEKTSAGIKNMARLSAISDVLSVGSTNERWQADLQLPVAGKPAAVPPLAIIQALDKVTLYHLQEKAWAAMEGGDVARATRRLERVASKLLAGNEPELAGVVRGEIDRMGNTRHVSAEGRKRIKYGTRALIAAPRDTT
jgi:Ca-activated chloride channel family protein